ncbi:MAG: aminotransferase [Cohaesibacter sp.]|nr:aminotransferase [Cohaesibacter sp.]
MKATNSIYTGMPTTIFEVMSQLARESGSINLGQGFPDIDGPLDIRQKAAQELISGYNQYPPMLGLPILRQAVADANKRFYGLDIDPDKEVVVTSGATEALSDCLTALIEEGDEVILIEPLYDCYLPLAKRAGARVKSIRIVPPNWQLDRKALEEAFSDKTKLIVLNDPHNPAGKVYSDDEKAFLAHLLQKYDAYAICDEVYEHITFDGRAHKPLMSFDGMRDRCLRIGSAGKTFSLTGWKIGYITGSAALLDPVAKAHQFSTFTTPPNLQVAIAHGLNKDEAYYQDLASDLQAKRDHLATGLRKAGFAVIDSQGSYFLTTDITSLCEKKGLPLDDEAFCRTITAQAGVTAVPVSAFYIEDQEHLPAPKQFVRFCFCKQISVLDEAIGRLAKWAQ